MPAPHSDGASHPDADTPAPAMEPPELSDKARFSAWLALYPRPDSAAFRAGWEAARRAASGSLPGGERDWLARTVYRGMGYTGEPHDLVGWKTEDFHTRHALSTADEIIAAGFQRAPPPPAAEPVDDETDKPVMPAHDYAEQWARDTLWGQVSGKPFAWEERNLAQCYLALAAAQPGRAEAKELREKRDAQMRAVEIALSEAQRLIQVLPRDETRTALHELWSAISDLAALAPPPGDAQEGGR